EVLLNGPGRAHPPARHLVDHQIGPEDLLHFLRDVVTGIDHGGLHITAGMIEKGCGGLVQGGVVTALGMGERLAAVDKQDLFHEYLREMRWPAGACAVGAQRCRAGCIGACPARSRAWLSGCSRSACCGWS